MSCRRPAPDARPQGEARAELAAHPHAGRRRLADAGTVLITGGSRGIGAAVARQLGGAGRRIFVSYRADAESARAVVGEVTASGGDAIEVQADMAQPDDIERLFSTVDAEPGNGQCGVTGDSPDAGVAAVSPSRPLKPR